MNAEVVLSGLSAAQFRGLTAQGLESLSDIFPVYVAPAFTGAGERPTPLLGAYRILDGEIRFRPRFPFVPGVNYRAEFIPPAGARDDGPIQFAFAFEKEARPPTKVSAVFPSASELPENLLKFYIHFSESMARGQAYSRIQLLAEDGSEIAAPFPEFSDELWDRDQKRLTVFLDPGRIKRGIALREKMGPPLTAGHTYTLLIPRTFEDARGDPLEADFQKTFRTYPADYESPQTSRWNVARPNAGTRSPLIVNFGEALDSALSQRVITVEYANGQPVYGTVQLSSAERKWAFKPDSSWRHGRYALRIAGTLEDLAGNSLRQPFEVDLKEGQKARAFPQDILIAFEVQ